METKNFRQITHLLESYFSKIRRNITPSEEECKAYIQYTLMMKDKNERA